MLAWLQGELGARLSHKESLEGHRTAIGSDKDECVGWASGQGECSKMQSVEAKHFHSKKSRTSIKKEDERARIEFAKDLFSYRFIFESMVVQGKISELRKNSPSHFNSDHSNEPARLTTGVHWTLLVRWRTTLASVTHAQKALCDYTGSLL